MRNLEPFGYSGRIRVPVSRSRSAEDSCRSQQPTPESDARTDAARPLLSRRAPRLLRRYDLWRYCEHYLLPLPIPVQEELLVPERRLPTPGITWNLEEQRDMVRAWTRHADLFERLRSDPAIARTAPSDEWYANGYFDSPDAEAYAAMIAESRPDRIVEIGGGHSTLIARATIDELGLDTNLVVIDPAPRTDVTSAADEVRLEPIHEVDFSTLALTQRSILFVDTSHVLEPGTEVPFVFGEVLPTTPPGALIHVHDIFLPYDVPRLFIERVYMEQYVFQALLAHSNRYDIVLAMHALCREHPGALREVFGDQLGRARTSAWGPDFGCSFWLRVKS